MCESMSGVYSATYWLLAGMEEIRLGSLFLRATNAEDALGEAGRRNTFDVANYVSVSCDGEEVAASHLASPSVPSDPDRGGAGAKPQTVDLYRMLGLSQDGLEPVPAS
ncbi:hypothetical protein [Hansschlegelia beijingensis]|uniref:Uncharacterized protein n=1 Tax=Hansschlegelia beijingensis TaxID=1133344 RepID=A0A7W6GGK0_9HYPH|nr:hypothetical protein [Hansschlegelia beijingensis]MBB3974405.1 hypothetical protein [Hansschlegelia beijingensis]